MTGTRARFRAVCFDFDSTLSRLEGIDELAARKGLADRIEPLTAAAMDGTLSIEDVYAKRLEIIQPHRADIAWLADRYIAETVTGAAATLGALHAAGVNVYIVSGGLREAILPMAAQLQIPESHVYAIGISFNADGTYRDFDRASPLSRATGKTEICAALKTRHGSVAMVGDGVTDLAARDAGVTVIGFGGVAARDAVRRGADHFVADADLSKVLDHILEPA